MTRYGKLLVGIQKITSNSTLRNLLSRRLLSAKAREGNETASENSSPLLPHYFAHPRRARLLAGLLNLPVWKMERKRLLRLLNFTKNSKL